MLEGAWSDKVLALPGCGPALSSSMEVVWVGPRARMGISEAIPSRVVPHTTSGRADYFGPLVNRWVMAWHGLLHRGTPCKVVQLCCGVEGRGNGQSKPQTSFMWLCLGKTPTGAPIIPIFSGIVVLAAQGVCHILGTPNRPLRLCCSTVGLWPPSWQRLSAAHVSCPHSWCQHSI